MNPCVELCWQRYGKQYSPECDTKCDYAKAVAENKALKKVNTESADMVPVVIANIRNIDKAEEVDKGSKLEAGDDKNVAQRGAGVIGKRV